MLQFQGRAASSGAHQYWSLMTQNSDIEKEYSHAVKSDLCFSDLDTSGCCMYQFPVEKDEINIGTNCMLFCVSIAHLYVFWRN